MHEVLGPDVIPYYDPDWEQWMCGSVPGPENQTVLQETLDHILLGFSMEEGAVCKAMLDTGATQEQIAEQLGTTRKAGPLRLPP